MGVSCCGQAKDQAGVTNNQILGAGPGIIDSQPAFHQVLDYNNNSFQQPNLQTPPNAHHSTFSNGFQHEFRATSPSQQQAIVPTFTGTTYNGQTPSQQPIYNGQPQMREFDPSSFQQTPVPAYTGTTFNGSNFSSISHSITRPKSSHSPHSPPPQVNAPILDEGKMSVSIDFGVYPHVTALHSLILVQVQLSLVL